VRRKVVEPSEILTGRAKSSQSRTAVSTPWLRFLARMSDYALWLLALKGLYFTWPTLLPIWKWHSLIRVEYAAWIPLEAVLLWAFGKTPGKWFLRIDLRQGRNERPSFPDALKRSCSVWLRGLGMAIPVISALCMTFAYYRLQTLRITSWDREGQFQIAHRFVPNWRIGMAGFLALLTVSFYLRIW